jgi:anaerobic selenocysteine-containing dehydrogenase
MAICGNLDIPGGNIHALEPPVQTLAKFVHSGQLPDKKTAMLHAHFGTIKGLMTVPSAYFKKAILEEIPYPVRGAYMQGTNPLVSYADSYQTFAALNQLEFFAVSDIFMTPTASLADIVLPAATHLEFDDIGHYGLGHGYILARPKVVDPPNECWPDLKILNALGRELTGNEHWYDDHRKLLAEVLEPTKLTYEDFCKQEILQGVVKFKKYQDGGFRTPSGKVELTLSRAETLNAPKLPSYQQPSDDGTEYPLILTSWKSRYFLHSSYRWVESLRRKNPAPIVLIHPRTAVANGIKSGCRVVIETERGCIVQVAKLSDTVKPGIIAASIGWWFPEKDHQLQFDWQSANYNILTTTGRLGKEFGTPNLKGIPCRIRLQRQMDGQAVDDMGSKATHRRIQTSNDP